MSPQKENILLATFLLGVLVVSFAYAYYSSHPSTTQPEPLIANIQLRSISVGITSLNRTQVGLDVKVVVYNPNSFGAVLSSANYSVYVNGHFFGSGRTTERFELAPHSSQTLVFPISAGWNSALGAAGSYLTDLGHNTWEIKGSASVNVGGLTVLAPFDFTSE